MASRNRKSGRKTRRDDWYDDAEREATAYHEAGHAVIKLHVGLRLISVDIIQDDEDFGSCNGEPPSNEVDREMDAIAEARDEGRTVDISAIAPATKIWMEKFIRSCQAGPLAEGRHRGRRLSPYDPGIDQDLDAIEFFATLRWDKPERERRVRALEREVDRLLGQPSVWGAVKSIAQALLEREALTGSETQELYRAAMCA